MATTSSGPKVTCLGQLVIFLFIACCIAGAGYLYVRQHPGLVSLNSTSGTTTPPPSGGGFFSGSGTPVEIGVAYGTEKKPWLIDAVADFNKTPAGANITVNLIGMGSVEGAQAIEAEDKRINVWFPASSMYKEQFLLDWQAKNNDKSNPILSEESMALTPMVFVFWKERYDAFIAKYQEVNFSTIGQALQEKGGWDAIAQKPDWGLFKFGHTHPNKSNSGVTTLVLMAYEYQKKDKGLTMHDILDPGFQTWMTNIETDTSGMIASTGDMMNSMVLRGPSTYDCVFVYESTAIDYLPNATGRWGDPQLVYPKQNMWNDNPYYILNVPWSTPEQRKAAQAFSDFLLSEATQKKALTHGFRPANAAVPIIFPESPFAQYAKFGVKVDVGTICEPPKAEVINNLLEGWQRSQGSR